MKRFYLFIICGSLIFTLIGCGGVSAPYVMKTDRVDQAMESGNRGYLKGTPPPPKDRGDLKRPLIAVDVDLPDANETK